MAVAAAMLIPLAGHAQHRVLFIGNSFTIGSGGGGVPGIFDRLAQAGGQPDPTTVMRAVGGVNYLFHSQDATTLSTIASQPWTHVILQNYSTEPTHLVDGTRLLTNHFIYGTALYQQIMSNSPQTQVILFETWSRAAAHPLITGISSPSSFASTAQFQLELRTNYQALASSLNTAYPGNPRVKVAPVGDAWENAGGQLPASDPNFVSLYGADNYHGNNNGYYLAASVFYSQIYGVSPRGLGTNPLVTSLNLGLTLPTSFLEDVAWATVSAAAEPVGQTLLLDFGATAASTGRGPAPDDPLNFWNNVTADIGVSPTGQLLNLVNTSNMPTGIGLVMSNRFNSVNEAGTSNSTLYPANATRDSLFGNTETFGGLSNIFPAFKLTGLDAATPYSFTFYASRAGAADNRETGYTVTGSNAAFTVLNASGNIDATSATISNITPNAAGEILISLAPTANNNNANHFTYLGVLRIDAVPPQSPITFTEQPTNQTVAEFASVTFRSAIQGSPPFFIRWLSNGVPIPGANQPTYTIPSVTAAMDGALFSISASNLSFAALSSNAVLRVVADSNPPVLLSVSSSNGLTVELVFNERLDPASATVVTHYLVNGQAVVGAALRPDGKSVVLTLGGGIVGTFTVSVSLVRDVSGNVIGAGTTLTGEAPDVQRRVFLIDFGASSSTTEHGAAPEDPVAYWNNVTDAIGASASGQLQNLITSNNSPTTVGLVMLSRFNGANTSGTTAAAPYPTEATRDSLFGNTELFNNLANIFPSFKLTGLEPSLPYRFTFYASRTGVSDNRETRYTVTGTNSASATLNVANNVTNLAIVSGIKPTALGEIITSLAPTAANNNANHFTYLGVLKVEAIPPPQFLPPIVTGGQLKLNWAGSGRLEWAPTVLGPWTAITPVPAAPYLEAVALGTNRFFRLIPSP